MPPRLRPEVIIPLRSGAGWARTLLLGCCAFIMFVTTVDALRYAARRDCRAEKPQRARAGELDRVLRDLDEAVRDVNELMLVLKATSPDPR